MTGIHPGDSTIPPPAPRVNETRARGVRRPLFAALAAAALVVSVPAPGRGIPPRPPRPVATVPPAPGAAPGAANPDERLRAIVAGIEHARSRAAAPGLRDEERDAFTDLAWDRADEALADPQLRERGWRDPAFLRVHAELLLDDADDEEALRVLERLGAVAPDDPETHRLLAQWFMERERPREAVDAYRRSLALGGGADVRAELASALSAAGLREEGLAESARAIAADRQGYLGHFVRGWILGELGRRDEERREYLEAVRLERDDADLWAELARSWEEAGDRARAEAAWREVVRIDPSDEAAAAKLGRPP